MNNHPKISIIIPVYGVELYIAKCIESIKRQTFSDFEAILINDGTKDQSISIAEHAIAGDARFVILHKENGGQGSARNLGLDNARGDYIAFIDSDDYVEPDFLFAMYEKISLTCADVCTCDIRYVDLNTKTVKLFNNNPDAYKEKDDYLMASWYISNFMWDKLFKKDIFSGHRFETSLKTNEDVYILFELLYGKNIVSVERYLYNYLQRPHATSKGAPPSYIYDRVRIVKRQIEFSQIARAGNEDIDYIDYVYLKHFIFNAATVLARYSKDYKSDVENLFSNIDLKIFKFDKILRMTKKDKKVALSLFLLKISPLLYRLFVRFWFRKMGV